MGRRVWAIYPIVRARSLNLVKLVRRKRLPPAGLVEFNVVTAEIEILGEVGTERACISVYVQHGYRRSRIFGSHC